jgi:uncharacterized protein YcbX
MHGKRSRASAGLPQNQEAAIRRRRGLTISTIDRLQELYPQGRFETRRFRPNIVVSTASEDGSFVESD